MRAAEAVLEGEPRALHVVAVDVREAVARVVEHAAAVGEQTAQPPRRAKVAHDVEPLARAAERATNGVALRLEVERVDRLTGVHERRRL